MEERCGQWSLVCCFSLHRLGSKPVSASETAAEKTSKKGGVAMFYPKRSNGVLVFYYLMEKCFCLGVMPIVLHRQLFI